MTAWNLKCCLELEKGLLKRVIVTDTLAQTYPHLVILCKIEHKLTSAHPDKIENIMCYLMDFCEFTSASCHISSNLIVL